MQVFDIPQIQELLETIGHDEMLKDMKASVFEDQIFKSLAHEGGKAEVKEM